MGPFLIVALVLYILCFAFFTYACVVADPETSTVARLFTERLPNYFFKRVEKLLGPTAVNLLSSLVDHLLLILYLVLVLGSWSIMFTFGYKWMSESNHVSSIHKYTGYAVFIVCMSSWRYASNTNPGIITERTLPKFDNYSYDNLLFVSDRLCPTVGIRKLARSKYDRVTNQHIARFDHFCGWLNQPIGEENYRFFLLFLLVHVIMCSYGTYVTAALFWGEVIDKHLLDATFFDVSTGEEVTADWKIIAQYLFRRHFEMAAILLLMGTMSVMLGAFLGFHVWITSRGMTTNETVKWKQVKKWHKHELRRYREALTSGNIPDSSTEAVKNEPTIPDGTVGCVGTSTTETEEADSTESPIMDPGPMPSNIYDNGFVENWKEVIFPRSLRPDAVDRWMRHLKSSGAIVSVQGAEKKKSR